MQPAASADQQQISPEGFRIGEFARTSLDASGQSQSMPYAHMLRGGLEHLLTAWRWLESKRTQQLASRRLRLSETISLGEKRSVSIVQVDGSQYLIGCSSGSVQLLAILDKQDSGTPRLVDNERMS